MIKNTLLLLLLVCTAFGCSPSVSKDASQLPTYHLKHKFHQELFFYSPRLAVMEDYLVLVSFREGDSICRLYDIDNGMKEVAAYGRIGNGPGEFIQPILCDVGQNEFSLSEINYSQLSIIRVHEEDGKIRMAEEKRLKEVVKAERGELRLRPSKHAKIGNDFYVGNLELGSEKMFALMDSTLTLLYTFGEMPIKEDLDPFIVANRLQFRKAVHGSSMFCGTGNLPYLASYTLHDGKMQKDWSLFYDTPHYGIGNGDLKFSREQSKGPLLDLRVDDKYIYLLYRDRLLWELEEKKIDSYTDEIFVFDHQGNKVAILKLDCNLSEIVIDKKRNKIYGQAHTPDYALVEFDLPKELQ